MEFDDGALFQLEKLPPVSLADKFLFAPFSVLDRRSGDWQERKRRWMSLGIKSEEGRDDKLTYGTFIEQMSKDGHDFSTMSATSIFDPVLCELAYRWFSADNSKVLDPFAGGSVRGVVASHLSRHYTGIELRPEQVRANNDQLNICTATHPPRWVEGDARTTTVTEEGLYDLVFTCPPYADLEVYSDDPRDLSTMPYPIFREEFKVALANAYKQLRPNRFFIIVIGDARSPKGDGHYYGLIADTVNVMREIGAHLYNDLVTVDPVGTLAARAGRYMSTTRKVGRGHQHMMVFVKGDGKLAANACGEMEAL
jgi:16S rRNA G966 N2-methylase RsmD